MIVEVSWVWVGSGGECGAMVAVGRDWLLLMDGNDEDCGWLFDTGVLDVNVE